MSFGLHVAFLNRKKKLICEHQIWSFFLKWGFEEHLEPSVIIETKNNSSACNWSRTRVREKIAIQGFFALNLDFCSVVQEMKGRMYEMG